ncbi:MAG TPA: hypothetical protein VMR21_11485, partial [Vicinamibacteria bacterium]|nr:hypothetical protein [Vicinamibacteria bacterium]
GPALLGAGTLAAIFMAPRPGGLDRALAGAAAALIAGLWLAPAGSADAVLTPIVLLALAAIVPWRRPGPSIDSPGTAP